MVGLPAQIEVIVRDWLNANQILLRGRDGVVLIDTGYVTRAAQTLALLRQHIGAARVDLLVNTHCHSDHMGCNAAVQRTYACRTLIPEREAPLISAWDDRGLWLEYTGQEAERFDFDGVLQAGETYRWGDLDWLAVAAPGHAAGALVFWNAQERILISGDALWERGFGLVMPEPQAALEEAQATLEVIAGLAPRIVIPGHGQPFADVDAALERCFGRVRASRGNPERMTRHAFKAMLSFTLLDKGGMLVTELPQYLQHVAFFREFNAKYLQRPPEMLAQMLVAELEQAGVVKCEGGRVAPV